MNKDLLYKVEKPHGILISTEGPQKTGKTEFGLSLPSPLFVLDLNLGLEGVAEKHVRMGKEIYSKYISIPYSKDLPGAPWTELKAPSLLAWREAITSLQEAMSDPEIKSIFIDTGSELWDLLRIARLGKLAQVLPIQYTAVNAEFRQLLQMLLCSKKFVVLSHKVKPEYVNDVKTNNLERAGFNDVAFDAKLVLRMNRDPKQAGEDQFTVTVMDSRANKEAIGKVIRGKSANFLNLMGLVYPDISAENWQ